MKPKIEKGIPIPHRKHGGGNADTPDVSGMEIGDSQFYEALDSREMKNLRSRVTAHAIKQYGAGCYTCRTEPNGIRVWRTK